MSLMTESELAAAEAALRTRADGQSMTTRIGNETDWMAVWKCVDTLPHALANVRELKSENTRLRAWLAQIDAGPEPLSPDFVVRCCKAARAALAGDPAPEKQG